MGRFGSGGFSADDDPSGISTYSVTGAAFGYAPLWTALFAFPLMTAVHMMCVRLGMVTGEGLAGVIRRRYPRPLPQHLHRIHARRASGRDHAGHDGDDGQHHRHDDVAGRIVRGHAVQQLRQVLGQRGRRGQAKSKPTKRHRECLPEHEPHDSG